MDTGSRTTKKRKFKKKILPLLIVFTLLFSAIFITGLISLPAIVSTAAVKGYLERYSAAFLTRGLRIDKLSWSWNGGIVMKHILVEDDPSFSGQPVILIEHASVRPGFGGLLGRRLVLDVEVDGIHFNYIRHGNGKSNLDTLLRLSEKIPEEEKKAEETSPPKAIQGDGRISIPMDIVAKIHLDGIFLSADDRISQKHIELDNGSVHLDIPSVYQHPVTLNVNAGVRINRNDPIPIRLFLSMENKGESPEELRPENLSLDISGVVPGIDFNAGGDLAGNGVKSKVGIFPGKIIETMKPFLPEEFKDTKVDGRMECNLAAKIDDRKRIDFEAGIHVEGLKTSGKFIRNKPVGPLNVAVKNKGVFDLANGTLEISDGRVQFMSEGIIEWNALVSQVSSGKPKVNATVARVYLNLKEIHDLSAAFLPPDMPLKFYHTSQEGISNLKLEDVLFTGGPGADGNRLDIKRLAVDLPGIEFRQKDKVISVHDVSFALKEIETEFKDVFPLKAGVKAELTAGRVNIPGKLNIRGLTQELGAEYRMETRAHMELLLQELAVRTPSITLVDKSMGRLDADAGIRFRPCRIIYHQGRLDIEDGGINFTIGDFVSADMNYTIRDAAKTKLQSVGAFYFNLGKIPEVLPGSYREKTAFSGDAALKWQFSGRLPNAKEKKLLASISGIDSGEALSFIEHAGIRLSVNGMKTHVSLDDKNMISAGPITASPLIGYEYDRKENAGVVEGHIIVKDIAIPRQTGMDGGADLHIELTGRHDGLRRISLSEKALLKPFSIEQSLDINLFGAENILEKRREKNLQAWLATAGGDVQALLRIKNMDEAGVLKNNLDVSGDMAAGVILGLLPGKMASARIWIDASQVDLGVDGIAAVNDFNGRVNIKKTYQIVSANEKERGSQDLEIKPLSSVVMENAFGILPVATDSLENSRWTYAQAKNRFHPERTIGFSSMHIKKGPVPLRVDRLRADINLEDGLPAIEYFQNDILGGTVSGSIRTERGGGAYFLDADINYTGIDFNTLLPGQNRRDGTEDTEVSGHLKLTLPITDDMDRFLRTMESHLIFTHIGSDALERLLYALDPYESNEAIVAQRRLLQKGSPKWAELKVADGNLSMGGAISVEGVEIDLPALDRLNIANLPGIDKYTGRLSGLKPVAELLEIASAPAIKLGENHLTAGNPE